MLWISLLSTMLGPATDAAERYDVPDGPAAEVVSLLRDCTPQEGNARRRDPNISIDTLRECIQRSLQLLAAESESAEHLSVVSANRKATEQDLNRAIGEVLDMLTFEPIKEAELPQNFPTYTRVGVIEVKEYPCYRMAVADEFWTLFQHIQTNDIAMTAPVQMEYRSLENGELRQASMAFLYQSVEAGATNKRGNVEEKDYEPLTVVSAGMRGRSTSDAIADAVARLTKWLRANDEYVAAGGPRVMAYNSPFMPVREQFYEVQIPVTRPHAEADSELD